MRRTVTGIRVVRTDNGADSNQILGNKVRESVDGIVLFGTAFTRVADNTLADLSGSGIFCRDTFAGDVEIEGNRSVRNLIGIRLFFCGASVTDNVANDNDSAGISRTRSNGPTLRNVAQRQRRKRHRRRRQHRFDRRGNVTQPQQRARTGDQRRERRERAVLHRHREHREPELPARDHDESGRRDRRRLQPRAAQRRRGCSARESPADNDSGRLLRPERTAVLRPERRDR